VRLRTEAGHAACSQFRPPCHCELTLCVVSCCGCAGPSGFSGETNGWCYKAITGGVTYAAAEAACVASGADQAHLAAIRDATQKATVMDNRCAGLIPVVSSPANLWCVQHVTR